MINFGILGCGRVVEWAFMPGMRKSHNARVIAIASRSIEKAKGFARRYKIPDAYGSYDDLLNDPHVDAVYIALPNNLHAEWSMKAAANKKHILCEKPLSLNSKESREMVKVCKQNRVILMEAFMFRFHPANEKARDIINSGKIGKVKFIRCALSFYFPPDKSEYRWNKDTGGGALFDVGCYFVNLSRFIIGREPEKVFAIQEIHPELGVDISTFAILYFPENIFSVCNSSFGTVNEDFYEVVGEKGGLRVEKAFVTHKKPVTITIKTADKTQKVKFPVINPYACEIDRFADCIRKGRLIPPAEDGVANMKVLDSISMWL